MNSRGLSYITSIDLRRVWIADEEKGLVFGLTMFRQPMEGNSSRFSLRKARPLFAKESNICDVTAEPNDSVER